MIDQDIRIEGFDARSWTNLLSLFAPQVTERPKKAPRTSDAPEVDEAELEGEYHRSGGAEHSAPDPNRGTLFVVVTAGGRVLAARHTQRGRVRGLIYAGPGTLAALGASHGAHRVVVVREGALEEIVQRASARMERHDDYLSQWLTVIRAVRAAIEAGLVEVWPRPLANVPIPSTQVMSRALDAVLPDERSTVLGVFSRTTPWTLVALRRSGGEIDRIVGPDVISRWTGALGGDFRRDHRVISEAVGRHLAPVHLGIYADEQDLRALLRDPRPGAWTRAVVSRDIIVQPTPPYIAVALAADGMRAAARRTESWMEGTAVKNVLAQIAPLASFVRGRAAEVASVTQLLGFDPLKLLAAWLEGTEPVGRSTVVGTPTPEDADDHDDDDDE